MPRDKRPNVQSGGYEGITPEELRGSPLPVGGTSSVPLHVIVDNIADTPTAAGGGGVAPEAPALQNVNLTQVAGVDVDIVPVNIAGASAVLPVTLAAVPSHPVTGPVTNTELRA